MKLTLIVFLAFLVASIPVFLFLSRDGIDAFGNLAQLVALLFAAFSFLQARDHAHDRLYQQAYARIAFGMLIWVVGQLLVTYSELILHQSPYGTVSSSFFVIGNAFVLLALVALTREAFRNVPKNETRGLILQACILTSVLLAVVIIVIKNFSIGSDRAIIQKTLDLLYPFFDIAEIVLAMMLIRMASRQDANKIKGYASLLGAFALLEFGDLITINTDFEATLYRAVDLVYLSSYFLLAISGMYLTRSEQTKVRV